MQARPPQTRQGEGQRLRLAASAAEEARQELRRERRRRRRERATIEAIDRVLEIVERAILAATPDAAAPLPLWIAWVEAQGGREVPRAVRTASTLVELHEALLDWQSGFLPGSHDGWRRIA